MELDKDRNWGISQFAKNFNFSRLTVRNRLKNEKVKPSGKINGYDVYNLNEAAMAIFKPEFEKEMISREQHDPEKMTPKERKDYFQSERERLKFQTEIGELIPDSLYRKDFAAVLKFLISQFEAIPDDLERKYKVPPEVLEYMIRWSDETRNYLADRIKELDVECWFNAT